MKLTSAQVERTLDQFEAKVIPEDHPAVPELTKIFGDHTYFLDDTGLLVVEATEPGEEGNILKVADWEDASRTVLACHAPEPTGVVVVLEDDLFDEE
ncbi:MAG TPA: hypothetical protein VMA37_13265 [Acetobacteraceae bacterium]|nr:hypothetical protein [Acetobacteraceae bacterium]